MDNKDTLDVTNLFGVSQETARRILDEMLTVYEDPAMSTMSEYITTTVEHYRTSDADGIPLLVGYIIGRLAVHNERARREQAIMDAIIRGMGNGDVKATIIRKDG